MPPRARGRAPPLEGAAALPERIVLWCPEALRNIDGRAAADDLAAAAPRLPGAQVRPALDSASDARRALASLAAARVQDPRVEGEFFPATSADLEVEELVDLRPALVPDAALSLRLYDGARAAQAALALLPERERGLGTLHVWVTRRPLATYSPGDMRYHARYAVFAYPVAFSLLGLALAPAPSLPGALMARELARRGAAAPEIRAALDREFPEERVDLEDPATATRALASCVLQASAGLARGSPFCEDALCRLFNPHRRAEVRRSLLGKTLCADHAALFGARRRGAAKRRAPRRSRRARG